MNSLSLKSIPTVFLGFLILSQSTITRASEEKLRSITFEKDIRPIFRAHCYDCHGAIEKKEGNLDLRLVHFMVKGGKKGPAIVPGKPEESLFIQRIQKGEMPPGEAHVTKEELKILIDWVKQGAKTARPEPKTIGPGLGLTLEERAFWSFQEIKNHPVPEATSINTPIDAFIVKAMPKDLSLSKEAERGTLIRRAYLTLIGLPPTPEEVQTWLKHRSGDWYEQLVESLLSSKHYGEKWGRHWLDIAGYADSEGFTVRDDDRPWAWKYRDWVIKAFNQDKPIDQFIQEQLAGDELAGPQQGDWTPEQIELFTATGFLRMAADGTGSGANSPQARNQVISDTLKIVGTSLLGLSLQCAQCHDHRYDPIPQSDYYSLRAIFEPALDWKAWKTPRQRYISLYKKADREFAHKLELEVQQVQKEKNKKQGEFIQQALEKVLKKFEEPLRSQLRQAYNTPGAKRSPEQKKLLTTYPKVNISPGALYQYLPSAANTLKGLDNKMAQIRGRKREEQFVRVLREIPNHLPKTHLFFRGDFQQPQQVIGPASLSVIVPEGERVQFSENDKKVATSGRRLAWSRWLTGNRHPLVARVIVNRIWYHHFGRGLVDTPSDFGALGQRPTHPQLLDWLAYRFREDGWSLKKLHRLILSSRVWKQSSENLALDPESQQLTSNRKSRHEIDPSNRYYWRKPLVRLEAEIIRDRILAATGELLRTQFGKPVQVKNDDTGQIVVPKGNQRRSIYVQVKRSKPMAFLQAFDAPVMETNCEKRTHSTQATQSLMLLNGDFLLEQARILANRIKAKPSKLSAEELAKLPVLNQEKKIYWRYGYGGYDRTKKRIQTFYPFSSFDGRSWRSPGGLPSPITGWAQLHATGGHPDVDRRSVIRRFQIPTKGTLKITGEFEHFSPHGNGVLGMIISSRQGPQGEWAVKKSKESTTVKSFSVERGELIDFYVNNNGGHPYDQFNWTVELELKDTEGKISKFSSVKEFQGKQFSLKTVPGQIHKAFLLSLCRPPSTEELIDSMQFIADQVEVFQKDPTKVPKGQSAMGQAIINLCQVLLTTNEFLYLD